MSISLLFGPGAMYGAYGGGVAGEIERQLGSQFVNHVYGSSVGSITGTFYVAGLSSICEKIWRCRVNGRKLINFFRVWNPLKLSYLEKIFRDDLDLDAVFDSRAAQLTYALTRFSDGAAVHRSPTPQNISRYMRAAMATPLMHPAVHIGDDWYFDGAFSDPLPVRRALKDGARLIIAVSNKPLGFQMPIFFSAFGMACRIKSRVISRLVHDYKNLVCETEKALDDPRVVVIRPSKPLPLRSSVDTDLERINATVDLGIEDARVALELLKCRLNL